MNQLSRRTCFGIILSVLAAAGPARGVDFDQRIDVSGLLGLARDAAGQDEAEDRYFREVARREAEEASFLDSLKKLGLHYKRVCTIDNNTVLDLSHHRLEFLSPDGRYARLRVDYHAPYRMEYEPALSVTGDPSGQDVSLKASSIGDFMRRTEGLALLQAKIAELTVKFGPPIPAADDAGGCSGEGWSPVPIEVR